MSDALDKLVVEDKGTSRTGRGGAVGFIGREGGMGGGESGKRHRLGFR